MNRSLRKSLTRLAAAVAASGALVAFTIAPAAANPGTSGSLTATGGAQMEELAARYGSLGGALINFYATQKGMTATSFMQQNPETVAALLGITPQQLQDLPADGSITPGTGPSGLPSLDPSTQTVLDPSGRPVIDPSGMPAINPSGLPVPQTSATTPASQADQLSQLQQQIAAAGLSFTSGKYASLEEYAGKLSAQSSGVDAAVVASGATWAKNLAALRVPSLAKPTASVNQSSASKMPKEGLMFGLFLNKSLTSLVSDSPDVFGQVQKSGVGTSSATSAWQQAMQKAAISSQADFTKMLPSQCGASLLAGMGTGSAAKANSIAGSGCSSCTVTGLYMNSQMLRLFDSSASSTTQNTKDGVINPAEWNKLQNWQKQAILQQNPNLQQSLSSSISGGSNNGSSNCATGSTATSGALSSTLPGVFSNLQK
jgi:hypothetical protein